MEDFLRATQRGVWWFVARLAGIAGADDPARETHLRAMRAVHRFEGRAPARTWLLSIARRTVVDQIRSEQARSRTVGYLDWASLAERGQRGDGGFEELVGINLLLNELAADSREALVRTQLWGLSYQQGGGGLRLRSRHGPLPGGRGPWRTRRASARAGERQAGAG